MAILGRTLKIRLYPNTIQATQLLEMSREYQRLANLVSQWVFDHDFPLNSLKINHALYKVFRRESPLNSQMIQSVFRTVVTQYKTVLEQMRNHPYRYQDDDKNWVRVTKDLT